MNRARGRGASPRQTSPVPGPGGEIDLESLVRVVVVLGGERASALLSGLADPLRGPALRLLRSVERSSRAERQAALAVAFAGGRPEARALAAVPGRLGACLRSQVDRAACPEPALPVNLDRWARRLARELAERV